MKIMNVFPGISTLENLQTSFSGSYETAVTYGTHVIAAAYTWDYDARDMVCVAAVYVYSTDNHGVEAPVVFVKQSETDFPDVGHALEWGINLSRDMDAVYKVFGRNEKKVV